MRKKNSDHLLCVPLSFVVTNDGKKKYDFKAMIDYFYNRLTVLGYEESREIQRYDKNDID